MWLISDDCARDMRARLAAPGLVMNAEARAAFEATVAGEPSAAVQGPRNLLVAGDTAEVAISGVLTKSPSFILWLLGYEQTSYQDIRSAVAMAANDPSVKRMVLKINSPGGTIAGLFDTLGDLEAFGKPKSVVVSDMAASAAYAIAAAGGKIEATNPAAQFGSIGVVTSFAIDEKRIEITSTEAPNKRPDVTTPEGQAVVRAELDDLHALFADSIATNRDTTVSNVNQTFGRGGVFVAAEAKRRGMIDTVRKPQLRAVTRARAETDSAPEAEADGAGTAAPVAAETETQTTAAGGSTRKGHVMTKEELKLQHPDICAEIASDAEAKERDRVVGHLNKGEAAGALDIALKAIRSGAKASDTLDSEYWSAMAKKQAGAARQADDALAGAALDGVTPKASTSDLGDEIVALMESRDCKVSK